MAVSKERQPNSDAREEFIVVVEYLINYAYDEEHATSQSKILEYAKAKYNMLIRRDRIQQILIHIAQLVEQNPNRFPFKLRVKPLAKIDKFYVTERMFSDSEILDIVSSINNDGSKSPQKTQRLVDKFLAVSTNEHKREELKNKITKRLRNIPKMGNSVQQVYDILLDAMEGKKRVWIKLRKHHSAVDSDKKVVEVLNFLHDVEKNNETIRGYVYKIVEKKNRFKVIVYVDEIMRALVINLEDIIIAQNPIDMSDMFNRISFELKDSKYTSIEEWTDAHYKGQDGAVREFTFKVVINAERQFNSFKENFEKYWKIPYTYTVKEREISVTNYDENGNEIQEVVVAQDAYTTIKCNIDSFRNWYMNYEIFSRTVITSPAFLNDLWLGQLTERLMKRLTKYGAKFNYDFTKEMKPEYAEEVNKNKVKLVVK